MATEKPSSLSGTALPSTAGGQEALTPMAHVGRYPPLLSSVRKPNELTAFPGSTWKASRLGVPFVS